MASLAVVVACCALIALILLVIVPLTTYYLWLCCVHRSNPAIRKRHFKLNVALVCWLMLALIGNNALYVLAIALSADLESAHSHLLYEASNYVYYLVLPAFMLTQAMLWWMIYFDIEWLCITDSRDARWTHFIDPHFNADNSISQNWFIRHQSTAGNSRWLCKRVAVPLGLAMALSIFGSMWLEANTKIMFATWMGIFVTCSAVLHCKMQKQHIEVFRIRRQLDLMMALGASFAIFFAIYVVTTSVITQPQSQLAIILAFQYISTLHLFGGCMVCTRFVLRSMDVLNTAHKRLASIASKLGLGEKVSVAPLSLSRILRQKLSFDAFMSHCLKEFSSENMLAIVEFMQFKNLVKELNDGPVSPLSPPSDSFSLTSVSKSMTMDMEELILNEALHGYVLPAADGENMPRSHILYGDQASECVEDKALKLINKYILSDGIFEVNISSQCKQDMVKKADILADRDQHGKLSMQQLYDLFDGVLVQLIHLLSDSYSRFMLTNDYRQIVLADVL